MTRGDFDVTVILNYYAPYISGLTETARIVAVGLVDRGWRVAVVTTCHNPDLLNEEILDGVHVFRAPIAFKIGRGPVSPAFLNLARRIAVRSSMLHLHLPMLEAAAITWLTPHIPILTTYHIDVWIPPSVTSKLQIAGVNLSVRSTIRRSDHVVVNSNDQARYSLHWPTIKTVEWSSIPAPCLDPRGGTPVFRDGSGYHIGFLGRIVPDKGIEYLIHAFRQVAAPEDRLLLAGEYDSVAGGSNLSILRAAVKDDARIRFLGLLDRAGTRDFYASIDTFALTSVAESFGIVQAEAMMCGLPVVGSDLPGGRVPIAQTGFGRLTQPRDIPAIARALNQLRDFPSSKKNQLAEKARSLYGANSCIDQYSALFYRLLNKSSAVQPPNVPIAVEQNDN